MPSPAEETRPVHDAGRHGGPLPRRVRAEIAALTDRGLVRETNEDAFVVYRLGRFLERVSSSVPEQEFPPRVEESGHVMIVADGMGGHRAGEVASRSALVSTLEFILHSSRWALRFDDPATREAEIREVEEEARAYVRTVHAAVRDRAAGDARLLGMGTTLTGAYCVASDLFVSHIGDSKGYLVRDGRMTQITRDHTVAQEYADLGVIAPEEVPTHRMHHVLTRAVGGPEDELEGDFHHLEIADGDRLLLCTDGLTDMAAEDRIAAVLAEHSRSAEACRALVDLALAGGGRDNVTVIVAGFSVD